MIIKNPPSTPGPQGSESHTLSAYLGLHGAVLLFGVAGLFGKWIEAPALVIVFGRVLVATVAFSLLPLVWRTAEPQRTQPLARSERLLLAACGALLALHWSTFFAAIQVSTVAVGLLSYSTAPLFVVLLEPWVFRERFSPWALWAAIFCMGGVALMVDAWTFDSTTLIGTLWGVASGLTFAILSLFNRSLAQRHSSIRIAFHQDAWATVTLALILPLAWQPAWRAPGVNDLLLMLLLGVFCTALAHSLFIRAIREFKAGVAAIASALEPVYGIALAAVLLGETPSRRILAGGAVILMAVTWATLKKKSLTGN